MAGLKDFDWDEMDALLEKVDKDAWLPELSAEEIDYRRFLASVAHRPRSSRASPTDGPQESEQEGERARR